MDPRLADRPAPRGRRRALAVTAAGVLALALVAGARPAAAPVELWVEPPPAGELTVAVGGEPREFSDAGPVGAGWRVVVLLDQLLSEPLELRNGAVMLAERAAELTALGPVEIVLAGDEVRTSLPPTTSAPALDEALAWVRVREGSRHLQAERRRQFAQRPQPTPLAASAAAAAERDELAAHLDRLLTWAADAAAEGPQLLLYVGGGYEADPAAFYTAALGDDGVQGEQGARDGEGAAGGEVAAPAPLPAADEIGRALSVLGWTVIAFQPPARGHTLAAGAEESEAQRLERRFEEDRDLSRVAVGVDPRKLGRRPAAEQIPVLADPGAPLAELARLTGGELITDPLRLGAAAAGLGRRHRLRVTVDSAAEPLAVAVGAGDADLPVRRWIGPSPPRAVSAARVRQLLREELDEGDFWVEAVLEPGDGEGPVLTLRLEPGTDEGDLLLTLGAPDAAGGAQVVHRRLAGPLAADGTIRLPVPASLAPSEELPVAVLVEEAESNRRGATFASLRTTGMPVTAELLEPFAPPDRLLRLLPPESAMVIGRTLFRTLVDETAVSRVEFFLDGELSAESGGPAFSAELDLGPLPRTRRVAAVAYGAGGGEVARDSVVVNGGSGLLEVEIVSPGLAAAGSAERPLTGSVEVEAAVEVPRGARLDRVEFYWRDRLVATRYAPPFRERIEVLPASPRGFVRVVARLVDGTSGEDVVFLNSPGPSERLDIDLVELFVVVTDGDGRPVTGLQRERFRLREDKQAVEITTFGDGGDLPLTVGLAIDSSASMFVKLPRVQLAARQFIRGLESRRDRAFVVGFGSRPRLARTATTDLPQVVQALDRLRADGRTAIWEAIAFSLVQLQGVPGKKALIVYSDGADEDAEFSYRTCLRFARSVGAPVYVILSNNEIVRTEGKGLGVRGFLGRLRELTSEVGGRVYLTRVGDDLDAVYQEIAAELRSQYFIGYYSEQGDGRSWRRLEVDVRGAGLSARTIAGFYR